MLGLHTSCDRAWKSRLSFNLALLPTDALLSAAAAHKVSTNVLIVCALKWQDPGDVCMSEQELEYFHIE